MIHNRRRPRALEFLKLLIEDVNHRAVCRRLLVLRADLFLQDGILCFEFGRGLSRLCLHLNRMIVLRG